MQEYSQGVPAFFISHGFILLLAGNTKHILFRVFCVIRRFFWGLLRKMFWSSEDRVRARFHYAESRQNKPLVNL